MGFVISVPSYAQSDRGDYTEQYLELAKDRRLQAEIDYLLPTDPLDLDRTKKKDSPEQRNGEKIEGEGSWREGDSSNDDDASLDFERTTWFLISGLILLGIAFVIYQNSAGSLVSFSKKPKDGSKTAKQRGSANGTSPDHTDLPKSDAAFLAGIEAMEDKQQALHLLSGRLIANASEKSGIRPGRSWTARESLRALPRTLVHLTDLRHINRQAELAWFGGRPVNDSVFDDCLTRARTMMRGGIAAR